MKRLLIAGGVVALMGASALPLAAHHSFAAEYDSNKPINLTGAVTKIEWNNPHVYFYIDVRDEKTGKVTNWARQKRQPARQCADGHDDQNGSAAGRRIERRRARRTAVGD
jgi:hypothetical protein